MTVRLQRGCIVLSGLLTASPLLAQNARDSAGVRIIENRTPAWTTAQRWQVNPRATLTIGLEEGDAPYLLSRVYAALRLDLTVSRIESPECEQESWFHSSSGRPSTCSIT